MRIYGGGHMAPYDEPEACFKFYNRWLNGAWSRVSYVCIECILKDIGRWMYINT